METFIYFSLSFLVRMIVVFTVMMKYYHWVDKDSLLWKITKWPFKAIVIIFFVLDILYNYVMTIYFLDLPAKWDETVTNRMARYLKQSGIKRAFARMMRKLLNYSDPNHL